MKATRGTIQGGQVSLSEPVPWPDGTTVQIQPVSAVNGTDDDDLGIPEDEQADDPESIARWVAEFDAIPALEMTTEEEAEWQAARSAQRAHEKATFNDRAEKLRRLLE